MLWYRWKTVESYSGTWWTYVTCQILLYSATVVKPTNYDFLSPGWKITISSLSTSALAALKIRLTTSLEHRLEGSLEDTLGDFLYTSFASYGSTSYIFLLCFTALLKRVRRLYIRESFLSAVSV